MAGCSVAKVTARKETGKLVIDFTFRGVRCREQTSLSDTAANRKRLLAVVVRIKSEQDAGTFSYRAYFPESALAARFDTPSVGAIPNNQVEHQPAQARAPTATPSFSAFAETWFEEHKVEWRRSHIKVLRSTLDGHLLPHFASRPIGEISKSDVMAFRAKLASLPGRVGAKLSNKRINGIIAPLRQILADAADRHAFVSPCVNLRPLRIRKSDVEPFTLDQVQQILTTVRVDYRDYFTVRFLTGMRTIFP